MITDEHKMATLGVVTLLLQRRKELDTLQATAATYLSSIGGRVDSQFTNVADEVGETVYNSGDDPEVAATALLDAVGLGDA